MSMAPSDADRLNTLEMAVASLRTQRDAALAAVKRVRALHQKVNDDGAEYCGWFTGKTVIDGCGHAWPCPTIRAIDGEVTDAD